MSVLRDRKTQFRNSTTEETSFRRHVHLKQTELCSCTRSDSDGRWGTVAAGGGEAQAGACGVLGAAPWLSVILRYSCSSAGPCRDQVTNKPLGVPGGG